jgi:ribose 5-phosphate isomerase A
LENDVEGVLEHGIYTQADVVITLNPETLEAVTIERD